MKTAMRLLMLLPFSDELFTMYAHMDSHERYIM